MNPKSNEFHIVGMVGGVSLFLLEADEGVTLCNQGWSKAVESVTMAYVSSAVEVNERRIHSGEISKEY